MVGTVTKIAVVGLGSMGFGMATSLLESKIPTFGFDVNEENTKRFVEHGGKSASLADIAPELDALVVVVLNAAQTESVLFGKDGVVPLLKRGSLVMACATVPPGFAKDMASRCSDYGVEYLDAPISGGAAKAARGELTIMASGSASAFTKAGPILKAVSAKVFNLGDEAGPGSAMKAVNQLLAGVHIATMAEALTFGLTQGVSAEKFIEVIPECAGTSWMLENRAPHIAAGDYTPLSSVNIWPKDLGIVMEIARASGFSAPLTEAALQQFLAAVELGLGGEDDAAVAKVYAKVAKITLPPKG
ncbi:MAG: L-threonate dehydrogenase [Pseudomonadota bacterium]